MNLLGNGLGLMSLVVCQASLLLLLLLPDPLLVLLNLLPLSLKVHAYDPLLFLLVLNVHDLDTGFLDVSDETLGLGSLLGLHCFRLPLDAFLFLSLLPLHCNANLLSFLKLCPTL